MKLNKIPLLPGGFLMAERDTNERRQCSFRCSKNRLKKVIRLGDRGRRIGQIRGGGKIKELLKLFIWEQNIVNLSEISISK